MDIFSFITLGGGLAMFLYGMDVMGDGLKSSSGETLKNVLGKVSGNVFSAFMLGVLITALIQSSTATIVICVGLLGAGMLNLKQAVSITMGANVGTTITAQIIRLLDVDGGSSLLIRCLKPDTLAPAALIVGIIITMAIKKDAVQNVGKILIGFGVLFVGLLTMTDAMSPLAESESFRRLILRLTDTPIITMFIAIVFTAVIASSSATVGVLQTLCSTGLITFRIAYFYVIGAAIGTCITTSVLCSIGTKDNAKRVSMINIMFNVVGAVIFVGVMEVLYSTGALPNLWNRVITSGGIADFQTMFKLGNALVFLPFVGIMMKLACRIIKDDPVEEKTVIPADRFDTHLLKSPALAMRQCEMAVTDIASNAGKNLILAIGQLEVYDKDVKNKIYDREDYMDELADRCTQYLIELSPNVVSDIESENIGDTLQAVSEFERIGDLAINIQEISERLVEKKQSFSGGAKKEIEVLEDAVIKIVGLAEKAFENMDYDAARDIEPLEEVIDDLVEYSRNMHTKRLKNGQCKIETGIAFLDMLTNLERIGDQCSNLALLVLKRHNPGLNKHEYIRHLHNGESQTFNRKYSLMRDDYMDRLKDASSEPEEAKAK